MAGAELGVFGLWMGLATGPAFSVLVLYCWVHKRTDWDEQVRVAQDRAKRKKKGKGAPKR